MPHHWVELGGAAFLLVVTTVYLCLKHRGMPRRELVVSPDACSFCGRDERENFFCRACFRRMTHRYAAILCGIVCLPFGAGAGYLYGIAAGRPVGQTIFFGIMAWLVVYNVLAFSYLVVYRPSVFDWGSADSGRLSSTFRVEWWRLKLLLKQAAGARKTT